MKNRSQPFVCVIADKTVGISLRHGGGLQEPNHVYVRCDERDCQYVDLNQPPCPLRIEMFADGSDRRVADYLTESAGTRICYACLTEALDITHDQVRRASWRLKDVDGFSIRPSRCATCQRRRVTIGLVKRAADLLQREPSPVPAGASATPQREGTDVTAALDAYLRSHAGFAFCARCLATEIKADPVLVRDAMWTLEPHEAFQIRTTQCVSCLLTKRVIRFQETPTEPDTARQILAFFVDSQGRAFCAPCVAFATDVSLADAKRVMTHLEALDEFSQLESACHVCGRWQMVLRFESEGDDPNRLEEIGSVLSGHVRHRGFRIDVLSFRMGDGWRPFALIKASSGSFAPSMIVMDLVSTKIEADELAVQQAREWIDKRVT